MVVSLDDDDGDEDDDGDDGDDDDRTTLALVVDVDMLDCLLGLLNNPPLTPFRFIVESDESTSSAPSTTSD